MTKVIVTGGAGFIGSHLVDALVARGDEVHVVDNAIAWNQHERLNLRALYHSYDIRDMLDLEGAEIVFHLAAIASVQFSIDHPRDAFDMNVRGLQNILELARQSGVKRFVFSSSSSVYGDSATMPVSERSATAPMSPYAAHKLMSEILCQTYTRTYALETVCLRYFNVYGPRLDPSGAYAAVIGVFLDRWRKGHAIAVTGNGTQTRDFVHVNDVVKANLLAAFSGRVGGGEVINIGSGEGTRIKDLALMFANEDAIEHAPARDEPKHSRADIKLARRLLGWAPSILLEDGIAKLKELAAK